MAIKGKNKSRSKQRSAPRAPRHEPITPSTPLLRRRWVVFTAGALAGVIAMVVLVWVTNSLRADEADVAASTEASNRRAAATSYQKAVRDAFSQVGVVEQGIPPTIFADMDSALDALAKGQPPADAKDTFVQAADDASKAGKDLASFDVAAAVRDQGFDPGAIVAFTGSANTLTGVFDLYRQSARVAASAVAVEGPEGQRLADVAVDLRDTARGDLIAGWTRYLQALQSGGIAEALPGGGSVPDLGAA
jgi:hypothetical protein